jgi:hypothetical protein
MLRAFLDEAISCLRECVQEMKVELVFNLNKVGMGRSEGQESDRPEDDGQSTDTSPHITKYET